MGARGTVRHLEEHLNSEGRKWITFTLEGSHGGIECVCFPGDLQRIDRSIRDNDRVTIFGRWSDLGPSHIRVLVVDTHPH